MTVGNLIPTTFMQVIERVNTLQQVMKERKIDAYIIPSSDPHQSEYVAKHFKSRTFISGFTGSAGTVLITLDNGNGLWTDGRYFLQAEEQLKGSSIDLYKMGEEDVPTLKNWLRKNMADGSTIGFDSRLFSAEFVNSLREELKEKEFSYHLHEDLIDLIWDERPSMPQEAIFTHDLKYAGQSASEKIKAVREELEELGIDQYIISSLDDIVWLYNFRGKDVTYSPVAYSYALITKQEALLYIDINKVSEEVKKHLIKEGITIKGYNEIWDNVKATSGKKIALDMKRTNYAIYSLLNVNNKIKEIKQITANLKACKNPIEIENLKSCHIRDNVAMVKFLYWLKSNIGKEPMTEISIADKLEDFRADVDLNVGISFDTIAGYKEHGAIIHYKADEATQSELKPEGLLLLDSGGQYYDGTTDITRTIVLGKITDEMKKHFTLVLKGNIALSKVKFRKGIKGANIDVFARMPLWEHGLDYKHGTGHGVGFFLNVHEGPHSISEHMIDVPLKQGMVVTNEPGYYVAGEYGIRLENDLLVVEDEKTQWGQFYKFDVLTHCPFDLEAVDVTLLKEEEKQWLNNYHKKTFDLLSPYLNDAEKAWLKENTREV